MNRYLALLPAAGVGARMGGDTPKQYLELAGRPMLRHAIAAFDSHPAIAAVHVVLSPDDGHWPRFDWSAFTKLRVWRCGGASRAASVLNGLDALAAEVDAEDWVLVHDAARPCLTAILIDRLIDTLRDDPVGGLLALPVADTLKRESHDGRVLETVPRAGLWGAQTPQMFRYGLLREALRRAGPEMTDEASAIERMGLSPRLVMGDARNLKVTWPADRDIAEHLLRQLDNGCAQGKG